MCYDYFVVGRCQRTTFPPFNYISTISIIFGRETSVYEKPGVLCSGPREEQYSNCIRYLWMTFVLNFVFRLNKADHHDSGYCCFGYSCSHSNCRMRGLEILEETPARVGRSRDWGSRGIRANPESKTNRHWGCWSQTLRRRKIRKPRNYSKFYLIKATREKYQWKARTLRRKRKETQKCSTSRKCKVRWKFHLCLI